MTVLRVLAMAATLIALLALGAAFGDFASDPNPLGAVGLVIVVAGVSLAVARLYGPQGVRESGPQLSPSVAAPPKAPSRPRRRPSVVEEAWGPRSEPAHLWAPDEAEVTPPRPSRADERRREEERREREAGERHRREAEAEAARQAEAEAQRGREAEARRHAGDGGQPPREPAAQPHEDVAGAWPEEPGTAGPAPARNREEPRRGRLRRGARTADGRLDLNRAAAHEIAALPGVGPASGERVVEDRRVNGPFSDVYELTRVEGFNEARVRRFADKVTV